jgi:hypothetical protein
VKIGVIIEELCHIAFAAVAMPSFNSFIFAGGGGICPRTEFVFDVGGGHTSKIQATYHCWFARSLISQQHNDNRVVGSKVQAGVVVGAILDPFGQSVLM